jgi:hypothetical protein
MKIINTIMIVITIAFVYEALLLEVKWRHYFKAVEYTREASSYLRYNKSNEADSCIKLARKHLDKYKELKKFDLLLP